MTVLDWDCASLDALNAIKAIPAADVAPVRYGRWVWDDDLDGGEDMHYYCSICLHNAYGCTIEILGGKYRYCPNCGAKMDGKSADYAPATPYDLLYEEGGPDA